ncbi:F-box only protein 6 [Folsomia candida]|uniref:F-box only protein 6 n=1 Tax=Folsomia candida TaxID=158441 RepID=UPI000B8FD28B|nr:F-box only protein 6 [Folsomia candida]
MGNFISGGRTSQDTVGGDDHRIPREHWPNVDVTWVDFQKRRKSPYYVENDQDDGDDMGLNGFLFPGGFVIPDSVIELILALVRPEDILRCNLVCKNWKDIITRKSYWKIWFDRNKWDWNMIPQHIKDMPQAWIVFHAQVRHHIFTKNYVVNHSGVGDNRNDFRNWTIDRNGGDRWKLETNPKGCNPLSPDPFFDNSTSAWVTSFSPCSKWTSIDLWEMGLTPPVMMTCLPFSLVCSQMYTARFDSGGVFTWTLRTLDRQEEIIHEFTEVYELKPEMEWQTATHPFPFKEEHIDNISELRSLVFVHQGKDDRFWKGHYGIKFSRSCVKLQLDTPSARDGDGVVEVVDKSEN